MFITETDISWLTEKKTYSNKMKTHLEGCVIFFWLGYLGSNQGMSESEADALPLGYTPINQQVLLRLHQELLLVR